MTADATSSLSPFRLNRQQRWESCIHEAGHAIVAALGGYPCRELVTAPEGAATGWQFTDCQGVVVTGSAGFCSIDHCWPALKHLSWNEDGYYDTDVAHAVQHQYLKPLNRSLRARYRQGLRALVCDLLAGPLAKTRYRGEAPLVENSGAFQDDFLKAEAYCDLLPFRTVREFEHARQLAVAALEDYWPMVMTLAEALEKAGRLSEEAVFPYLPPPLANWPPSPACFHRWRWRTEPVAPNPRPE